MPLKRDKGAVAVGPDWQRAGDVLLDWMGLGGVRPAAGLDSSNEDGRCPFYRVLVDQIEVPHRTQFFFSFCLSLLALVLNIHHQCFVFLICEKFIEDKKKVLNVSLDARVMQR